MKTILAIFYCLMISITLSAQQAGSLDYSFGDSGKVISKYFGSCRFMVLQKDNKILCGGTLSQIGFRMVRYLNNGIVDSTFGKQGIADIATAETFPEMDVVKLQDDQKIVIGGWGYKHGVPTFVIARCLPDGSLDESFGTNGIVDTTFGIGESTVALGLQPDGKIIVTGWYAPTSYITARYNTDGTIDESFGNNGTVFTNFGEFVLPSSTIVQPDNKILVAGSTVTPTEFLLVRYMPDGSLDNSFGNNGKTVTDFGTGDDVINAAALQPDGKIVVSGVGNYSGLDNMALARYQANGVLDTSFGQGGKVTCKFKGLYSQATAVLIQPDNKIIISGISYNDAENVDYFTSARYLPNGIPDSSYGINSQVLTDVYPYDFCYASALQNDGKVILAGTTEDDGNEINYTLVRYNNDSKKQIIVTKIRHWIQHHNGIEWNNNSTVSSYVVQRSYDGIHFSSITKINAGNNFNYTYADASPLSATNYYRLQTTSIDGAVNYSNIIAVTADEDAIKISPNPAKNNLNIQGLPLNQKSKFTVVDFTGKIKIQAVANATSYNLNIASLATGNYLLKIEMNGEVVTKQFVKE